MREVSYMRNCCTLEGVSVSFVRCIPLLSLVCKAICGFVKGTNKNKNKNKTKKQFMNSHSTALSHNFCHYSGDRH